MRKLAVCTLLLLTPVLGQHRYCQFVGPMLHYYFSGKGAQYKWDFTGSIEYSYWYMDYRPGGDRLPVGFDVGLEMGSHIFDLYAEFQVRYTLIGLSAGPVLFLNDRTVMGLQTTVWSALYGGISWRNRFGDTDYPKGLGLFFKCPVACYPDNILSFD